ALLAVALLGVFQIGLGFLLLARALIAVGPVTANLLCAIEPILNPLLVALVFGERPGRFALLGAALVLAGVIWYQLGQKTGLRSGQKTPSAAAGSADTGH
ncbi:MAG TPA: EamA family transporter, partial [Candidatus Pygmaiobacter gallistercoris]|nr:EamA family transporter [Candidatus Pygmaiobacter gallistercoris]